MTGFQTPSLAPINFDANAGVNPLPVQRRTPTSFSDSPFGLQHLVNPPPRPGGEISVIDQLTGALGRDLRLQQAASDDQFNRNNEQIAAFEALLGGLRDRVTGTAGEQAGLLRDQAAQLTSDFGDRSNDVLEDVRRRVDSANSRAADAVQTGLRAESEHQDRTAQNVANSARGIRQRAQSEMANLKKGINPDGSIMTPEERNAARQDLMQRTNAEVNDVAIRQLDEFNKTRAQLTSQIAQLQTAQAQTELGGAGTVGQVGTALGAQGVQMANITASMHSLAANLQNNAELFVTQAELAGRGEIAGLVSANNRGIVSLYAGLSSLLGAATIPGIQELDGFRFQLPIDQPQVATA